MRYYYYKVGQTKYFVSTFTSTNNYGFTTWELHQIELII